MLIGFMFLIVFALIVFSPVIGFAVKAHREGTLFNWEN